MKKSISISELRSIIREVLEEAPNVLPPTPSGNVSSNKKGEDPVVHRNDNRRVYNADGTSKELQFDPSDPNAPGQRKIMNTQMPPTMHPPTVPAKASNAERAMDLDLKALGSKKNSGEPKPGDVNAIRPDKSAGSNKAALVHKALTAKGVQADISALQGWIAQMDPADSLIKTADDLASEWMAGTS
jgi:hypothetical protein